MISLVTILYVFKIKIIIKWHFSCRIVEIVQLIDELIARVYK